YSEGYGGGVLLRAVTPDKQPVPMPEIAVPYGGGNRYRFMPDGKSVVIYVHRVGQVVRMPEFELLDLSTGHTRPLSNLRSGFAIKSFDVSRDGKEILFDRFRENSDIVLIDLPPR